jgi:prophage regulatory protein
MTDNKPAPQLLSQDQVCLRIGVSRGAIYKMETRGDFPRRLRITSRKIGWLTDEIEAWIKSRPRGVGHCRYTRPARKRASA